MENSEQAKERFTHYYNEQGDYTVVFDYDSDKEIPICYLPTERHAQAACDNLNKIIKDLTTP